eukprot:1042196-Pyramimonas_sp.AAC.1
MLSKFHMVAPVEGPYRADPTPTRGGVNDAERGSGWRPSRARPALARTGAGTGRPRNPGNVAAPVWDWGSPHGLVTRQLTDAPDILKKNTRIPKPG